MMWVRYLKLVTVAVIVFGIVIVVTPLGTDGLFAWMIFGETGRPDGFSAVAADYVRFSHGVLGAVMVGWFVLVYWVVNGPLALGLPGTWRALVISLTAWFALDTGFSLATGYWQNAVLNAIFFGAYVPGLAGARKSQPRRPRPEQTAVRRPHR